MEGGGIPPPDTVTPTPAHTVTPGLQWRAGEFPRLTRPGVEVGVGDQGVTPGLQWRAGEFPRLTRGVPSAASHSSWRLQWRAGEFPRLTGPDAPGIVAPGIVASTDLQWRAGEFPRLT